MIEGQTWPLISRNVPVLSTLAWTTVALEGGLGNEGRSAPSFFFFNTSPGTAAPSHHISKEAHDEPDEHTWLGGGLISDSDKQHT
ncbi:hypothetical protein GGS20DRAFT_402596 [Poronia punctata]|nr:hypothetical protein GGS20DRAFT_402596 [Poronia punctata]